jgi:hypothetical protein
MTDELNKDKPSFKRIKKKITLNDGINETPMSNSHKLDPLFKLNDNDEKITYQRTGSIIINKDNKDCAGCKFKSNKICELNDLMQSKDNELYESENKIDDLKLQIKDLKSELEINNERIKDFNNSTKILDNEVNELKRALLDANNIINDKNETEELLKYEIFKLRKYIFENTIN